MSFGNASAYPLPVRPRERETLMAHDNDHGVRIGFRIEFRDPPHGGDLGKCHGAAYIEDAYLAAALSRPGDFVSSGIVAGYSPHNDPGPSWLSGPFLRVTQVEHYPDQPDVTGGTQAAGPGVQVVCHVTAPHDRAARDYTERLLSGRGWTVSWLPELP